ncbi:hypothetical protein KCP75_15800 [Salmonella enterica subsp. enterica]|nr:hypothetical protein KCP75_15800 [Salmonella enterica subsp. enterica]
MATTPGNNTPRGLQFYFSLCLPSAIFIVLCRGISDFIIKGNGYALSAYTHSSLEVKKYAERAQ